MVIIIIYILIERDDRGRRKGTTIYWRQLEKVNELIEEQILPRAVIAMERSNGTYKRR